MDFNVGLCKPSQREVSSRFAGGSQVFLGCRRGGSQLRYWTQRARVCCTLLSHVLQIREMFFAFSDRADASILSVALSCVCGSVKC